MYGFLWIQNNMFIIYRLFLFNSTDCSPSRRVCRYFIFYFCGCSALDLQFFSITFICISTFPKTRSLEENRSTIHYLSFEHFPDCHLITLNSRNRHLQLFADVFRFRGGWVRVARTFWPMTEYFFVYKSSLYDRDVLSKYV